MNRQRPFRLLVGAASLLLLAPVPVFARGGHARMFAPPEKQNRPGTPRVQVRPEARPVRPEVRPNVGAKAAQNQEHLQGWMESHKNLSLSDMQRALQNEPGFSEYPPQVQQRLHNQLARLYTMKPEDRQRTLQQNEILEHMSPAQVQQYRGAAQTFAALPQDRKRIMARAIIDLREMPPDQREQVIDSPRFGAQFSDGERSTIRTLLTAEPYPPVTAP